MLSEMTRAEKAELLRWIVEILAMISLALKARRT